MPPADAIVDHAGSVHRGGGTVVVTTDVVAGAAAGTTVVVTAGAAVVAGTTTGDAVRTVAAQPVETSNEIDQSTNAARRLRTLNAAIPQA
jgi:hypothetical protein